MRNPLHALCPYFAMFPESFAAEQIEQYSRPGDLVLDPFSGRGTTLLEALLRDRAAAASDINPVAYCVSKAKGAVPDVEQLLQAIARLRAGYDAYDKVQLRAERVALPPFFGRAFHRDTLDQILFLRRALSWDSDATDCFVAALVLGILHGEMDRSVRYLSNQMPRTISTKPAYSLGYWRRQRLWAKKRVVFSLLESEARFRLRGVRPIRVGTVVRSDVRQVATAMPAFRGQAALVVTSPPYFDVTRFEEDQWLRLWFLGNPPRVTYRAVSPDDRHERRASYWRFLSEAWEGTFPLLKDDSTVVVRIGARGISDTELTDGLCESFAVAGYRSTLKQPPRLSLITRRQTSSFRPGAGGLAHEIDYVFSVRRLRSTA